MNPPARAHRWPRSRHSPQSMESTPFPSLEKLSHENIQTPHPNGRSLHRRQRLQGPDDDAPSQDHGEHRERRSADSRRMDHTRTTDFTFNERRTRMNPNTAPLINEHRAPKGAPQANLR